MKVLKHTGLVPVRAKVRFQQNPAGTVFGMEPLLAAKAVANGEVELEAVPDGHETLDIDVSVRRPAKKKADAPAAGESGPVAIPENWDKGPNEGGLHHMQVVALAKKISPDFVPPEGKWSLDVAQGVISEELQRRAAADEPQDDDPDGDPNPNPENDGGAGAQGEGAGAGTAQQQNPAPQA